MKNEKSTKKGKDTPVKETAKFVEKGDAKAFFKANIGLIIKVQSVWRGKIARNKFITLKLTVKSVSKYFTEEDRLETVSVGKKIKLTDYNPNKTRRKRRHQYKSGAVYDGEWIAGFRDGYGTQKWIDGATYEGSWRDGRAHGKGKFTQPTGETYEGNFANDKECGFGIYTHSNGTSYEGKWLNGKQNGKGIEKWQDGSIYNGNFFDGNKQGYGEYKWNDGSEYKGKWKENVMTGYGFYVWPDERTYKGQWKTSCMHGYGFYTWPDGRIYEGQYKKDKKDGYGVYSWSDGRKYEGYWSKGKQHGLGVYNNKDTNEKKFGLWENGKRIIWFDKDQVKDIKSGGTEWMKNFEDAKSKKQLSENEDFSKPKGFDLKLIEVNEKLTKLEK